MDINDIRHPLFSANSLDWSKWRLAYEGGSLFKEAYLNKYSKREDEIEFTTRKNNTPVPAFAKTGINEIRDAISRRLSDVSRHTESKSYNTVIDGSNDGVDRKSNSMHYFLTTEVLPELLVLGRVGVYVDMPSVVPTTLLGAEKARPYLYTYKAEQIRSWDYDDDNQLVSLILEDVCYKYDNKFNVPVTNYKQYRHYWVDNGVVYCQFYKNQVEKSDVKYKGEEPIKLDIPKIPFALLELSSSLMTDVADYQIALMNLTSTDIAYAISANYPLYVEQYDPVEAMTQMIGSIDDNTPGTDGSDAKTRQAADKEVKVGYTRGRRIKQGLEYPTYISPGSECLSASMEKQEQMKQDIRSLLQLSLGNLKPTRSSAESKDADTENEENGLNTIAKELEAAERKIVEYWLAYERNTGAYTIKYPQTFDIRTPESRLEEAAKLTKLTNLVPSQTYKKQICKSIAKTLLSGCSNYEVLEQIYGEIDAAPIVADPEQLSKDVELGIVSKAFTSKAKGYPEGDVAVAQEEHVERAEAIALAQSDAANMAANNGARGVKDLSVDPKAEVKNERVNKKMRGKGRNGGDTNVE